MEMYPNYEVIYFTQIEDLYLKKQILEWRNDESIRKWMYNSDIISLEQHLSFIDSLKYKKDKVYFLVKRNNEYIGVFYVVDRKDYKGEFGYYLAPKFHQENLSVEFYYNNLLYCFNNLELKELLGHVLKTNKDAYTLNLFFGFEVKEIQKSDLKEFYYMTLTKEKWEENLKNNNKIKYFLELTK